MTKLQTKIDKLLKTKEQNYHEDITLHEILKRRLTKKEYKLLKESDDIQLLDTQLSKKLIKKLNSEKIKQEIGLRGNISNDQ